jgi:hypothetical protein
VSRGTLPPIIARWDLDKTYLRSDFTSFSGLLESAIERPDQKRSVPGAAPVLSELKNAGAYVHILSGSPRQLRKRLTERLRLDGVTVDRFTLKPNLSNLLRFRLKALKAQLGYKLSNLLVAASEESPLGLAQVPEILVGDDSEQDPLVYSLFADICQGRLNQTHLKNLLVNCDLYADELETILTLAPRVSRERQGTPFVVLIHLDRQTPPSHFEAYGARLVPFFNYFQASLLLFQHGYLSAGAVLRVGEHLLNEHRFDMQTLTRSFLDLERRGRVSRELAFKLDDPFAKSLPGIGDWPVKLAASLSEIPAPDPSPRGNGTRAIDYPELLSRAIRG